MTILPLLLAASQAGPTALEVVQANGTCYDSAFVGRIIDTDGFDNLNEVLRDGELWWGEVSRFRVRRDTQLMGRSPGRGWVKGIMSAQPLPSTKVLLLTKAHPSGIPIVVHWTILREAPARELSEARVEPCP